MPDISRADATAPDDSIPVRLSDGSSFVDPVKNADNGLEVHLNNPVAVSNLPPVQEVDVVGATVDMRGQTRVGMKNIQIHQSGKYPPSAIRHATTLVNGGSVTQVDSEYVIATTSDAASSAIQETLSRGSYICGLTGSFDISGRTIGTPTGAGSMLWGYKDAVDGYGFGRDATGVFVFTRKAGVTSKVYQADWNMDQLDGTGPSGLTLDTTMGTIYNLEFNWFGYGSTEYSVFAADASGRAKRVIMHIDRPANAFQRINSPNLPIRVEVSNAGSTTPIAFAYGGQAFAVIGEISPETRTQNFIRLAAAFPNSTAQIHVMSIRHKTTTNFEAIRCHLDSLKAIVTADVVLEARLDCALTGASFGPPTNQPAAESACEVDTSTTAFSGGTVLYGDLLEAAADGSSVGVSASFRDIEIPAGHTVTILARLISAANGKTISLSARWGEEW